MKIKLTNTVGSVKQEIEIETTFSEYESNPEVVLHAFRLSDVRAEEGASAPSLVIIPQGEL